MVFTQGSTISNGDRVHIHGGTYSNYVCWATQQHAIGYQFANTLVARAICVASENYEVAYFTLKEVPFSKFSSDLFISSTRLAI